MRYRFADHVLDLRRGTLEGPAGAIHLRPQAFKLLELLISRAPEIVPHEELLDRVWGTRHLSPSSLKQGISELRQALGDPQGAPLSIATVHRRGYRFVAAVEIVPEPPFPTVPPVPAAPEKRPPPAPDAAPELPAARAWRARPSWHRLGWLPPLAAGLLLAGLLLAGLLLAGGLAGGLAKSLFGGPAAAGDKAIPAGPRPVAALFVFAAPGATTAEIAPETSWVPTALAELLAIELASGGGLQVVGGDQVARLHRELNIDKGAALDRRSLERIRAYLGCDWVLQAAVGWRGETVDLEWTLLDALSAEKVAGGRGDGRLQDLGRLARQVAARLRAGASPPILPEETARGPSWGGADPALALRLYASGLERLRAGEAVAARGLLLEASAGDPGNALIHRALASAHQELGYLAPARAAAQRAFDLSAGLPREVRLDIEGQLQLARRDFAEAAEVYGALHRFFPDDLDHGLQLAAALAKKGEPGPAAAVLARLRRLPPPRGDHPSIDLQEVALFEGSDPPRALAAARAAALAGARRGSPLLVARGRREEGWMLFRLSRFDEALAALGEAEAIFRAAGDQAKVASVLANRATVLSSHGSRREARTLFEEAVRICREIGNPGAEAQVLNNFAAASGTDDLPLTRALLRRSLEIKEELGDLAGEALTRLNLANIARFENRLAEARELTAGALELYRQLDDKYRLAFTLRTLGSLLAKEGRRAEAAGRFEEARQVSLLAGDPRGEAEALYELGLLRLVQNDEPGALQKVRQSRDIFERLGLVEDLVLTELQIGDILWARGEPDAARELYRTAAARRPQVGSERLRGMIDQRLASGAPEPGRRGDGPAGRQGWMKAGRPGQQVEE